MSGINIPMTFIEYFHSSIQKNHTEWKQIIISKYCKQNNEYLMNLNARKKINAVLNLDI